jgi:ABC-2 type transport system ATP-binding protein
MSVKVQNLTKIYGTQRAVDAVSFEAKPGEVLGFLGPNGAGKSTTMKILTCYLPQSEGKVEVCGHDTASDAMSVRQKIGYLPEHNPLYKDMYVREYLTFVAGIHRLEKPVARVAEMIERTGLGLEQNKIIGALSKGYRQRVGLAQAMIHNPDVLILDEPTTGLDPNQLTEIRNLIKELGREKTVIFSTHIMQEVQAICDRVLIINHGKIVADAPIGDLQNQVAGRSIVTVEFLENVEKQNLERIKGVKTVKNIGKNRWQLVSPVEKDVRADVFQFAVSQKLTLLEMRKEVLGVEDIFQQLTTN